MFYIIEVGCTRFRAELASDPHMIGEVLFDLEQFLKTYPLSLSIEEIKQAVSEGLSNAIVHGNRSNPVLHVVVLLIAAPGKLTLLFENGGPGFDWKKHLSQTSPAEGETDDRQETKPKESGLRRLARLGYARSFNEDGTILTLTKPLPPMKASALPPSAPTL